MRGTWRRNASQSGPPSSQQHSMLITLFTGPMSTYLRVSDTHDSHGCARGRPAHTGG